MGADAGRCRRRHPGLCFAWRSLASRRKARAPRSTRARSFELFNPEGAPPAQPPAQSPQRIAVEFTIFPNGRIDEIKNLDALSPDQQQAWQQWASTFAAAAVFPADGIKLAQKWKSEEVREIAIADRRPHLDARVHLSSQRAMPRRPNNDPQARSPIPSSRPKPAPSSRPPPR